MNTPKELRRAAGARRRAPGVAAGIGSPGAGHLSQPDRADRFAFEPEQVEKPWGWELIWARDRRLRGKILFVQAGESLSASSSTSEKDESWYVQSRAAPSSSSAGAGDAILEEEVIGAGAAFRFRPARCTA